MIRSIILASVVFTTGWASAMEVDVAAVIEARKGLMQQTAFLSSLARVTVELGDESKMFDLYQIATATAQSLEAFALMLPEQSNLLGGAEPIETVSTTAAPAIWDDIEAFRALVSDSAQSARTAADSQNLAAFARAWENVEASCASCHEAFVFYDPFAAF